MFYRIDPVESRVSRLDKAFLRWDVLSKFLLDKLGNSKAKRV